MSQKARFFPHVSPLKLLLFKLLPTFLGGRIISMHRKESRQKQRTNEVSEHII